jgi:hypothetical protein
MKIVSPVAESVVFLSATAEELKSRYMRQSSTTNSCRSGGRRRSNGARRRPLPPTYGPGDCLGSSSCRRSSRWSPRRRAGCSLVARGGRPVGSLALSSFFFLPPPRASRVESSPRCFTQTSWKNRRRTVRTAIQSLVQ